MSTVRKPVRMSFNRMEHDRINVARKTPNVGQGGFTPSGYDHEWQSIARWLTPNENDLTQQNANLLLLSSPFRQDAKNRKTEIRDSRNQMTADSGMKNIIALIPNVGSRRPPVRKRDHTRFYFVEEICVWEMWSNTIHTHRERERGTKSYIFISKRKQLQMNNHLYKRLQSHFI